MEQESKSMEIAGYYWHRTGMMPASDGTGDYVLHSYHAAAMKAAQDAIAVEHRALLNANAELRKDTERMRVMREALLDAERDFCYLDALTVETELPFSFESKHCERIQDAVGRIEAALASTAPVAANMQPPTNDERLRMYESDEINGGSK